MSHYCPMARRQTSLCRFRRLLLGAVASSGAWVACNMSVPSPAFAQSIVDHIPHDALGVALLRDVAATSGKIEKLAAIFAEVTEMPAPAPLAIFKAMSGLGAGLNEQGDALVIVLPEVAELSSPRLMVVLSVSDYAKFAESINGDPDGEICRVTIAGEEVLVAKRGERAFIVDVDDQATLETALAQPLQRPDVLRSLDDWLAGNDIAAILLPAGVKMSARAGEANLAAQREQFEELAADEQMAEVLANARQGLKMFDAVLGFWGKDVDAVAAGLSIDDAVNLRLSARLVTAPSSVLAGIQPADPTNVSPLAGYADEPFVMAFGGRLPKAAGEWLAKVQRPMLDVMKTTYGLEHLEEAEWKEMEETTKRFATDVRSMNMILRPGAGADPLYSNALGIFRVSDAKDFLLTASKSIEISNRLMKKSPELHAMSYEVTEKTIGGKPAIEVTTDFSKMLNAANAPGLETMWKAMFGEDGKMHAYYVAASSDTVLYALGDEAMVAKQMDDSGPRKNELVDAPSNLKTLQLLNQKANWQGLVSPPGLAQWISRWLQMFNAPISIPKYPASPPVGFSWRLADGQASVEMAWPRETLERLAEYIVMCKKAF